MKKALIINVLFLTILSTTIPALAIMPGGCVITEESQNSDFRKKQSQGSEIVQTNQKKSSLFRSVLFSALHVASIYVGFNVAKTCGPMALNSYALQHASDSQKQKIEDEIIKDNMRNHKTIGIYSATKFIEILKHPAAPIVSGGTCAAGIGLMLYGVRGVYKDIMSIFK